MKILLLSKYGSVGASSRIRTFQYIPYLERSGVNVRVAPLLNDRYLAELYGFGKAGMWNVGKCYGNRLRDMLELGGHDACWLEKEALPWIPAEVELHFLKRCPYIVDYDDAVFHSYEMHSSRIIRSLLRDKIDKVMRGAAVVVAGNRYIQERARVSGARRTEIIPSVIDLEKYPLVERKGNNVFTIGWIGSPSTTRHLKEIEEAIRTVYKEGGVKIVLIGASHNPFPGIPVELREWEETRESEEISGFDTGIMPLPDQPWERGKCGFKLIQYMGCGIPVVGSPVGVNREIIRHGENGFAAVTREEWVDAILSLKKDRKLREAMGREGRKDVEEKFSLQVHAPRLRQILQSAAPAG